MKGHKAAPLIPPILAALAIAALTLYAYRGLAARPFAADDYQWLLNVRDLSFGDVARKAFDPGAQSHFYRPLIWLLFWAQTRAFGLDPRGFHAVSLALHLLNAALLGGLAYRLQIVDCRLQIGKSQPQSTIYNLQSTIPLLVAAFVALHPAPFEAVVWISAQSELLAAALLLVALHFWLRRPLTTDHRPPTEIQPSDPRSSVGRPLTTDHRPPTEIQPSDPRSSVVGGRSSVLATLALGLALLAKESAVIGLPLLMLLGRGGTPENPEPRTQNQASSIKHHVVQSTIYNLQSTIHDYILPTLVTLAYIALQIVIERRNYLLAQGGYGLGAQVVLNPLRSLALIVAPLPGTEHADAAWLVPLGAAVALLLIGWTIGRLMRKSSAVGRRSSVVTILALALTLLPTAPFASPPDSRYLYLPVMAAALLAVFTIYDLRFTIYERRAWSLVTRHSSLVTGIFVLALAWWASGELHAREGRFAAASGPGGSLWRVAASACAESRPERMVVVEPPVAAPHVEAIIGLACGDEIRTKIVGRDQVEGAIKGHTVVIAFPNGSAEVQRRT